MLTLREALTRAASQLAAHPDLRAAAVPDATLLLMHALAIDRPTLLAHPERPVSRDDQARIQTLLEQRLKFEPIQYILGTQEFFGLPLRVTPAVLIPRPETELLVEAVLHRLPPDRPVRILDVGTGSGAIAIALAHSLPRAAVTAVDLSPAALEIAQGNARTHAVADRIRFVRSDLLAALPDDELFDCIVSNPPYVAASDALMMHPQVREHEPAEALFSGATGLEVYERLIPGARLRLHTGGLLALEIGHGQREAIAGLLAPWHDVVFLPDLQGIPRVALASRP